MGIKDRLAVETTHYPRNVCRICSILTQLSTEDKEVLEANFRKPVDDRSRFSDAKIADILTDEGFPTGMQSVARHRRGQCGR